MLGLLLLLISCRPVDDPAAERMHRAREATGDLIIGAAWPWEARKSILYRQGMEMAVDEINREGVLGRKMRVIRADDRESVNEARLVAQRFADNLNMVAVIGHLHSFTTIPAAAIYDRAGLLLLAPSATASELTEKGYPFVFRTTFSNDIVGHKLADFASGRGYERIVICYIDNEYGRELANSFERRVVAENVVVVSRNSYSSSMSGNVSRIKQIVDEWEDEDFDAIFMAGEVPLAALIISQARQAGITAPVIGSDAMGVPSLIQVGGEAVEGTIVPSRFNPVEKRAVVQQFVTSFEGRYGVHPDAGAVAAYDAVHLLAHAIEEANSAVPLEIAKALRSLKRWHGIAGPFTFDENGNLTDKSIKLKVVQNGAFVPLDKNQFTQR